MYNQHNTEVVRATLAEMKIGTVAKSDLAGRVLSLFVRVWLVCVCFPLDVAGSRSDCVSLLAVRLLRAFSWPTILIFSLSLSASAAAGKLNVEDPYKDEPKRSPVFRVLSEKPFNAVSRHTPTLTLAHHHSFIVHSLPIFCVRCLLFMPRVRFTSAHLVESAA